MEFGGAFLMGYVLFSADLSEKSDIFPLFTPSNDVSRRYNIYETYLGQHPASNTYWNDWGGYYDNPVINQVEMYVGSVHLIRVDSLDDCCSQENSIYDATTAGTVYINVPMHTWLYEDIKTNFRKAVSFLSGAKNPNNPSDDVFNNEHWPIRLEVPKFTVKLSDVINGLTKYSTFDFILHNEDGYFDDIEETNFFNAPSYIRKSWKENPTADDFISIRYGMVESIKVTDNTMTVSCADIFRALEEPVSKVVKDLFSDYAVENQDENLPVVYGQVNIPLIEIVKKDDIQAGQYVAGENITQVLAVYDKDGNLINPALYSFSNGVITSTEDNVKSAVVTGNTDNRIGEVIIDIITSKTKLTYINTFFDLPEVEQYKNNSPRINIAFTGGTVNEAVKQSLSSDMVFLIQKNDGRFTLRKWGETYNTFNLNKWKITKFPVKDYKEAQKNYLSSCIIKYNYDFTNKIHNNSLLYNEDEDTAEITYSKVLRKEFKTFLINENDAYNLGENLSNRFSTLKETVQLAVGNNTAEINLLDTVTLELNINGRVFSKYTTWIVKEIDPAQDVILLENSE
jgi:hypothetical protein